MYNLTNVRHTKKLIKKFGFSFNKNLGQNFILDENVIEVMATTSCSPDVGVIEIGAGVGTLTQKLAKNSKKVVSFEIDSRLIPILDQVLSNFQNVKIINADILKYDINKLIEEEFPTFENVCICANLPYYLTTELIMKILNSETKIKSMVLMVQKEVAERICAKHSKKNSGAITFAVNYYADAEILLNVPKENFLPQPKVDSSVIKITLNNLRQKNILSKKTFFNTINFAFRQRRKNILNSLSSGFVQKNKLKEILNSLNINQNLRPEDLDFFDFVNISNKLFELKSDYNKCVIKNARNIQSNLET